MKTVFLAGAAKLVIATTPALTPQYSAGVPDYTVRCKAGDPVTVKASIPRGQTVAVDGQPPATGSLEQGVSLEPGQAFTFTVNGSATHNVRCLPSDMPRWRVQRRGRPVAQWFVFAPTLKQFGPLGAPYSVIADRHGVPVWWMRAEGATPVDARFLPDGTFTWRGSEAASHRPTGITWPSTGRSSPPSTRWGSAPTTTTCRCSRTATS